MTISLGSCPYSILAPKHWRSDGTCRCNDPDHWEMATWGYRWDSRRGRWVEDA